MLVQLAFLENFIKLWEKKEKKEDKRKHKKLLRKIYIVKANKYFHNKTKKKHDDYDLRIGDIVSAIVNNDSSLAIEQ